MTVPIQALVVVVTACFQGASATNLINGVGDGIFPLFPRLASVPFICSSSVLDVPWYICDSSAPSDTTNAQTYGTTTGNAETYDTTETETDREDTTNSFAGGAFAVGSVGPESGAGPDGGAGPKADAGPKVDAGPVAKNPPIPKKEAGKRRLANNYEPMNKLRGR